VAGRAASCPLPASLDFAGFLGRPLRSTIRHSGRDASGGEAGEEAAPGFVGNISDAARRLGPARPARFDLIPGPGQLDVTHARSPQGSDFGTGRFAFRAVSWPAREGFAWGGNGGLQGTSSAARLNGVLLPAGIFSLARKPPMPEVSEPSLLLTLRWRRLDSKFQFRDALAPPTTLPWCDTA
jgi:hypothetical protein